MKLSNFIFFTLSLAELQVKLKFKTSRRGLSQFEVQFIDNDIDKGTCQGYRTKCPPNVLGYCSDYKLFCCIDFYCLEYLDQTPLYDNFQLHLPNIFQDFSVMANIFNRYKIAEVEVKEDLVFFSEPWYKKVNNWFKKLF